MSHSTEAVQEKDRLLRRTLRLEKELAKLKRSEQVLREMEARYFSLMDSDVFLHMILSPDGVVRVMNRPAELFFGAHPRTRPITLPSLFIGPAKEVKAALKAARENPTRALLPATRADGVSGWLRMEFYPSVYQGEPSIQLTAVQLPQLPPVQLSDAGNSPSSRETGVSQKDGPPKTPSAPDSINEPSPIEPSSINEPSSGPAPDSAPPVPGRCPELLNAIPEMLCVVDEEARCVEVNDCFAGTLKMSREALTGRPFTELALAGDPVNEGLAEKFARAINRNRERENSSGCEELECRVAAGDGEILSLGLKCVGLEWSGGGAEAEKTLTLVSCTNNTRLRRMEEQLKRVSTLDAATGILNRQGMERVLCAEIERASRYRGSLSMIVMDVDGFRLLNERIGYAASDRVFKELAMMLKGSVRLTDFLGRWSSDEFMVLTPLALTAARQLAEQLRDRVEHSVLGEGCTLTVSAGVASLQKHMDLAGFVASAYDAMMQAKRSGGNLTRAAADPSPAPASGRG